MLADDRLDAARTSLQTSSNTNYLKAKHMDGRTPRRILVIGSTGGTGRVLLADGVHRGHAITAFARDPAALAGVDGLAGIAPGDARDEAAVGSALEDQDAVILTVSGRGEPGVSEAIARAVTAAAVAHGVQRIVATSAYGLVAKKPYVVASIVRRVFASEFADQQAADEIVEACGADWVILRATRLVGGSPKRPATVATGVLTSGPYSVTRAAYAAALLDHAETTDVTRTILNVTG
jgi:uncharacterized protein YbjT (DUF2867 family)